MTNKQTMGSARKEETTAPQSAKERTAVVTMDVPKKTTRKLAQTRKADWYLHHEGELELVTSEASNTSLGINMVNVFAPSEGQMANGVIANVRIDTVIGQISSLQVRESKSLDGSIYLSEPSRNIAKEGDPARWLNDVKLDRRVQAQILSYVDSLLVEA